jgi:tellurite resistance protein TehA-like permease
MSRSRIVRLGSALLAALAVAMTFAPAALAADGVGLYGRTDDRVVTYAAFMVIAFFTLLVITLSIVQIRLESRRERLKQDLERLRRP